MDCSLRALAGVSLLVCSSISTAQQVDSRTEGEALFTERVQPLLESACFSCHGPHAVRLRGGLMMSSHESLLEGGHEGPALVPGDPAGSLLIELVREEDESYRMPPKRQLDVEEIELLERWIELGAPWPGGEDALQDRRDIDLEEGRKWWSFRPLADPELPELESPELLERATGEIDTFIFARLEAAGLLPAPRASDQQLVRRLHFDLLGLPPTPERVEAYLRDKRPDKWELLVDELLGRIEYGERQGRAWLDLVRFAQTNGYERDQEKPMAWRYRDYVINSFHRDKPYDQFLREQLAGDELVPRTGEGLIASGFYHISAWDSEPDDRVQADLDVHDDALRTIGEGMLGLTIGCARCHDHRTDPIRQEDYYSLLAYIRNIAPYRRPMFSLDSPHLVALDATPEKLRERERLREASRADAADRLDGYVTELLDRYDDEALPINASARLARCNTSGFQDKLADDERLQLYLERQEAAALKDSFEGNLSWALAASEPSPTAEPTHILKRGRADSPLRQVEPALPPVLFPSDQAAGPPRVTPGDSSSGRRTALADWVASPSNPLTARVMVNRVWQGHFGRGLCDTPNDFGVTGARPTHPELIDWLALRFIESGWSVKQVHRLILRSSAYRMSASVEDRAAKELDPDNRLLSRQNLRRLDAEAIRDTALFVAGQLNPIRGGRGFFPRISREALAGASKPGYGWDISTPEQRNRRAIYAFVKRGQLDPLLEVFDLANPTLPSGKRSETTVASQALALLNSELIGRCAVDLADRVMAVHSGHSDERIARLYHLTLSRAPREGELRFAREYLESQRSSFEQRVPGLAFSACVPDRVEIDYLAKLPAEELLFGPRQGWTYQRGLWGLRYNQTVQVDRERGPSAFFEALELADGELRTNLRLGQDAPFAGLLLRAHPTADAFVGLQVFLDREAGSARLLQHMAADAPPVELASSAVELGALRDHDLRVRLAGPSAQVWLDGRLVLETDAVTRLGTGHIGFRTWGSGSQLQGLSVGAAQVVAPGQRSPEQHALASFALVLLNLNEFLYID